MKDTKVIVFIVFVLVVGATIYYFVSNRPKTIKNTTSSAQSQNILAPQTDSQGSVTVKVTPKDLLQSSPSWDFEIILDTHSGNLDQDLTKISVLADDRGNQFAPVAWEGDPPQGHHRQGTLKFKLLSPKPKSIELKIGKIGDVNERSFNWDLE